MEEPMKNLYEQLNEYSHSDYYGFHMPGHKRNMDVTGAGLPYGIDITEIEGFDDLHHAKDFLKKAQERAARVFHGEETCFLVNGSTVGILSAILGCTQKGDRILIARNCHKSVYHAVYMNELEPEYVYPLSDSQGHTVTYTLQGDGLYPKRNALPDEIGQARTGMYCGKSFRFDLSNKADRFIQEKHGVGFFGNMTGELNGEIRPEDIRDILEWDRAASEEFLSRRCDERISGNQSDFVNNRKRIRAVVITSPTYDGVVSDVEKIAEIVHSYGIPLIVDEAHGAHFGFHPYFPKNANTKGADVVIHSIHKTLPSLTQTALIHMNGNLADRESIKKYLHILQTSSPSYVLMAGIDSCIDWLDSEKKNILFENYVEMLKSTREQLRKMRHLQIVETDHFDHSKIVISVRGTKYSGKELYRVLLEKYHLQLEMAAGSYVLAMTSVGDTEEGFQRLVRALYEMDEELQTEFERGCAWNKEMKMNSQLSAGLPRLEQIFTSAEIEYISKENKKKVCMLPWESCAGSISMEYAYLYPPGIPLIVPGERISDEVILRICEYRSMGFEIEGIKKDGFINVLV